MIAVIWTAWNNGSHNSSGSGYGFKVDVADRDRHFNRKWREVVVELPTRTGLSTVKVNVDKPTFWGKKCRELINQEIGRWMLQSGCAPWPNRKPPKFDVQASGKGTFRIIATSSHG
jgi:hypothetical protein